MKISSKQTALVTIFASLYAVLVLILPGISYGLVQIRFADALIPLSIIFGWPVMVGVAIGGAISNFASTAPSIIIDITFGSVANLVASLLAWKIGTWRPERSSFAELLGCAAAAVVVTFMVGTYLALLTEMELWLWWLGVGAGSFVSIFVLGYVLVQITKKMQPAVT